ncbi:hypothetical protein RCCGEPOP_32863 [Rhizobium sp. Pop5]|nr:hypothetical protein RCCGEPOP_32863 [Rhizobium sp. Pop5]
MEDGFIYAGSRYRSLSKIAREITRGSSAPHSTVSL